MVAPDQLPSLILNGDDDPLIHPLNAQVRILPGAGHLFMVMQASRTARLIDQFLDDQADEGVS